MHIIIQSSEGAVLSCYPDIIILQWSAFFGCVAAVADSNHLTLSTFITLVDFDIEWKPIFKHFDKNSANNIPPIRKYDAPTDCYPQNVAIALRLIECPNRISKSHTIEIPLPP